MSAAPGEIEVGASLGVRARIASAAITLQSWRGQARTIQKMELAGYRTSVGRGVTYFYLIPRDPGAQKFRFSAPNSSAPMVVRALAPLKDLDAADRTSATEAIRQSDLWGLNPDQRMTALAHERRLVLALNWLGGLIGAWALIYPQPRAWAIGACVVGPVAVLVATALKQGRWRIDFNKNDPRPSAAIALLACVAGVGARAIFDVNMFDWQSWLGVGALVGASAAFVLPGFYAELKPTAAMITLGVVAFVFGLGCAGVVDTMFDVAPAHIFKAEIVDKYESHGRSTSYTWMLGPWGPSKGGAQDVDHDIFDQLNVGDAACVYFHPGALGMRWYVVSMCPAPHG